MEVIPAINVQNYRDAQSQIGVAGKFANWVHLDVCDGRFTPAQTWGDFREVAMLKLENPGLKFEVHLMVQNPERELDKWFGAGADRVILHSSAIKDFDLIKDAKIKYGGEIMLSVDSTDFFLGEHSSLFSAYQILAVRPGFAGQKFQAGALDKIRFLREAHQNAKIEVDGGINPETAALAKAAGADTVAAASYILGSADPMMAYERLREV